MGTGRSVNGIRCTENAQSSGVLDCGGREEEERRKIVVEIHGLIVDSAFGRVVRVKLEIFV